ncbi:hypothetical protein BDZ45DRAFT_811498 [Acephala macrosclerotiorum]|nr:hypothetical protein BDZ45DRAFT_811498 [Acephala macrosclerotiorum]
MTSNRNQYTKDVANAEDNEFPDPLLENYRPHSWLPQNGPGHHIESEPSIKMLECSNWTGPANVATMQGNMPALLDQFDGYFKSGTGDQWEGSFNFDWSPFTVPLQAPRVDAWTTAQEEYLMASKRQRKTFPQIRLEMLTVFGVDKNPNVLSKRYRAIIERNAKENVIVQSLNGALPNILKCFEDELGKLNPEHVDEELLRAVREELRRKLPKFVRSLDLERKGS